MTILDTIGNTPMIRMRHMEDIHKAKASIFAKIEAFNPGGSVKDRIALAMVSDAERRGIIRPGATIIEPTSGNTGIGLALVCAAKGYPLILTMPESMSIERRRLLAAYGAELHLTPATEGMPGAINRAKALHLNIPGSVILGQFDNPANPDVHYHTTAEEIIRDCRDVAPDYFIAGVGTGGSLCGTGRRLKEVYPNIKVIAVEPAESPVLSGGKASPHGIQGIGAGFVPGNYDAAVVDRVMQIATDQAYRFAREAARREGVLVGISSGAALCAAVSIACQPPSAGKKIVCILPDTGERYLTTPLFENA